MMKLINNQQEIQKNAKVLITQRIQAICGINQKTFIDIT